MNYLRSIESGSGYRIVINCWMKNDVHTCDKNLLVRTNNVSHFYRKSIFSVNFSKYCTILLYKLLNLLKLLLNLMFHYRSYFFFKDSHLWTWYIVVIFNCVVFEFSRLILKLKLKSKMMSHSCKMHIILCKYNSTIFVEAPVARNEQERIICSIRIALIRCVYEKSIYTKHCDNESLIKDTPVWRLCVLD